MAENAEVVFTWIPDPRNVNERKSELQRAGGIEIEAIEPKGVIPLAIPVILAGTIALINLAQFIYQIIQNERHPGLIIDVLDGKLNIREQPGLDHGIILLFTPQGAARYDTRVSPLSPNALSNLLKDTLAAEAGDQKGEA